ncbi:7468_t:CDS:2 [Ambispora gerdemannii]|uniref:7468_t:CDS:1 n=1 Tax=Ambispora gerdemannii TaxID=144530 RepID=A0A9N9EY25_9GLOM|nr:7468_t:CDS:2 [Ambispora gerdemannii]
MVFAAEDSRPIQLFHQSQVPCYGGHFLELIILVAVSICGRAGVEDDATANDPCPPGAKLRPADTLLRETEPNLGQVFLEFLTVLQPSASLGGTFPPCVLLSHVSRRLEPTLDDCWSSL